MFCSRCGKKVLEYMLFCPFCGTEIVIPEQDEAAPDRPEAPAASRASEPEKLEKFTFEVHEAPAEDDGAAASETAESVERFSPAQPEPAEEDWAEEMFRFDDGDEDFAEDDAEEDGGESEEVPHDTAAPQKYEAVSVEAREDAPDVRRKSAERSDGPSVPELKRRVERPERVRKESEDAQEAPESRERGVRPERSRTRGGSERRRRSSDVRRRRASELYAAEGMTKAGDMFMDDVSDAAGEYDDYDEYDDSYEAAYRPRQRTRSKYDEDEEDYGDEEESSGFVMRHIRGIVGFILFLVLLLVLVLYFLSDAGQTSLAHINATLPLKSEIYARLGRESYQANDYRQAGVYYERALAREPDSYNWASSAVMAYIADNNTDKAVEMLKKCIDINPLAVEPYFYLMNLYPDASSRPWEITQLLQQGYQTTGDARLNVNG